MIGRLAVLACLTFGATAPLLVFGSPRPLPELAIDVPPFESALRVPGDSTDAAATLARLCPELRVDVGTACTVCHSVADTLPPQDALVHLLQHSPRARACVRGSIASLDSPHNAIASSEVFD